MLRCNAVTLQLLTETFPLPLRLSLLIASASSRHLLPVECLWPWSSRGPSQSLIVSAISMYLPCLHLKVHPDRLNTYDYDKKVAYSGFRWSILPGLSSAWPQRHNPSLGPPPTSGHFVQWLWRHILHEMVGKHHIQKNKVNKPTAKRRR